MASLTCLPTISRRRSPANSQTSETRYSVALAAYNAADMATRRPVAAFRAACFFLVGSADISLSISENQIFQEFKIQQMTSITYSVRHSLTFYLFNSSPLASSWILHKRTHISFFHSNSLYERVLGHNSVETILFEEHLITLTGSFGPKLSGTKAQVINCSIELLVATKSS